MIRILIVEDSRTQAQALKFILESENFETEVAGSGEHALEALAEASFDAVISDVNMPGISGYDLCRKIKDNDQTSDLPVILLTARSEPRDILNGLVCGADNFISKPYEQEHLLAHLSDVLDRAPTLFDEPRVSEPPIAMNLLGEQFMVPVDTRKILDFFLSAVNDMTRTNRELQENQAALESAKIQVEALAGRMADRAAAAQEKYEHILNSIDDVIITIDEQGIIESANPALETILGYTPGEVLKKNVKMLMPEPDRSRHDGYIENYLQTGKGKIFGARAREVTALTRGGREVLMELGINELWIKKQRLFVGVLRDITERKETEAQLRQSQKMEAVGNLTGGVAHDFNNILAVILGNLQLLERRTKEDPRLQKMSKTAINAAVRGADLTKQLLAFSRRQELEPTVFDVNELVGGMDNLLRRTIGANIEIRINLSDDIDSIRTDPVQLESAILNLTINARDAMPEGGILTIETSNEDLDEKYLEVYPYAKLGPHVCVSVSDTGIGIPQDIQKHIFEPFFTTKEVGKGTGLGLSMVYGFVKQSGGHLNVYSEEGHGSRLSLRLPSCNESGAATENIGDEAGDLPEGSEAILLVEDEQEVRGTAVLLLEDLGYTVIDAETGPAGLRVLEAGQSVDLLFTDMVMPGGMNGHQLAEQVTAKYPDIKVLLTSGFPRDAFSEGRNYPLLQKPYTQADLATSIRHVLDKK